jgi:opacity protein-like surface antigen
VKGDVMVRQIGLAAAVAALVLGFGAAVSAHEADGGPACRKEIVFTFDHWGLGAYGGGIGLRYFLRDDVAIRSGLSLRLSNDTDNASRFRDDKEDDLRAAYSKDAYDYDRTTVGLSIVAEKYLAELLDVVPLVGLGLGYAYSSEDDHYKGGDYYSDGHQHQNSSMKITGHSGSLIGLVGVQWRLRDNISLSGEYRIKASLARKDRRGSRVVETQDGTTFYRDHRKTTSSALDFESGGLMLAIRF